VPASIRKRDSSAEASEAGTSLPSVVPMDARALARLSSIQNLSAAG
jgi:hypothetical protein